MNAISGIEAIPFSDGLTDRLVVVVTTESGQSGIGESGLTGRDLAVIGAIDHLRPLLVGQDAGRIEHLWQLVSRGGFFPAGPVVAAAQSAIDIALWDLLGKRLGVPVYELLGGRTRDRVACYPHNTQADDDIGRLLDSCRATVEGGWTFVRWGLPLQGGLIEPRHAIRLGLRQLAEVRSHLGDDIEICIDLHTRLDPSDALRFCREAEQFRPFFVEDPVRVENVAAMRHIRKHTAVPLAAGEQLISKWQFRPLIDEQLIDYARVDVCLVGGLTEARKVAAMCEANYIKLATHNPLGPVSSAACLHLNLACSNVAVQEQPDVPGRDAILKEIFPVQVEWDAGYLLPPIAPGLGVSFDRAAALARPPSRIGLPTVSRADGSFSNW